MAVRSQLSVATNCDPAAPITVRCPPAWQSVLELAQALNGVFFGEQEIVESKTVINWDVPVSAHTTVKKQGAPKWRTLLGAPTAEVMAIVRLEHVTG